MSDNSEFQLKRLPRFKPRSGIEVMYASIRALFLRELQTRFGHYRIGYAWALLEPAMNVGFMLLLFSGFMHRTLPGIDYTVFLINGIVPFYVFMRSATKALSAIESNRGLLSYRSVQTIDVIVARTAIEALLYFVCYVFFTIILILIGHHISFSNLTILAFYWILLFVFSIGFACIMMVIGELSKESAKIIGAIFIIVYFASGAMFPLHMVPEQYLQYFLWNPVTHVLELMRHAVAPTYRTVNGTSLEYFLVSTLIVLLLGLLLNQGVNRHLLRSK